MNLVFLDIDGVLNNHDYNPLSRSSTIQPKLMARLNKITDATNAGVVISSAWRYMIHGGAMTYQGFEYLLRTHGAHFPVVGYLRKDEDCVYCCKMNLPGVLICENCKKVSTRGALIKAWREDNCHYDKYVVIDDLDLGLSASKHPFIQTIANIGLVNRNVKSAIKILTSEG